MPRIKGTTDAQNNCLRAFCTTKSYLTAPVILERIEKGELLNPKTRRVAA